MKHTTPWTMLAAAALLALPATGLAQTGSTQPPATTSTPSASAAQDTSAAREHLAKARAALNDVNTANLDARAKNQVAELKRRLGALEEASAADMTAAAQTKTTATWGTEVAALDTTLNALLGPDATTGATGRANPTPTGTSGTSGARAAGAALDETSRTKLLEFRQHITAYATVMAGGTPTETPAQPSTSAAASTATSSAATAGTSGTTSATQEPPAPQTAGTAPRAAQADEQAARQHLTEARNTLSALSQLPEAAQLTGEARAQISQLISNFNELITTQSAWRESYQKVDANLTALIGSEGQVASGTTGPPAATGTAGTGVAGAVGTSGGGITDLDPAIREKLVELRGQLNAFQQAAGGGADRTPSAATAASPATTGTATGTSGTTGTTTPPAAAAEEQTAGNTAQTSNAEILRHVAAIDALLKMQDESGGLTLTKTQVEQLRTHWTALRQLLERR